MKTRKQTALALAKRVQRAKDDIAAISRASDVLTGNESEEARYALATCLNWLECALRELQRINDPIR